MPALSNGSGSGNLIKYDLRYRQGGKTNYGINDIHYSLLQSDSSRFNVTKLILVEKQPRYPIYYGKIRDKITSTVKGWIEKTKTGSRLLKQLSGIADTFGQAGGAVYGNVRVEAMSTDAGELEDYYGDPNKYLNNIKDLFTTLTTDHISTYELPFLSDYYVEADGDAGWKYVGSQSDLAMELGDIAKSLSKLNVGYPVTPNWEYSPKVPNLRYKFHLVNDTTGHLTDNVRFLINFIPGMLHVLLSFGQTENSTESIGQNLRNVMSDYLSLYKSPNVYEAIVPGRFRWLWCTLKADVRCVGKIFHDKVDVGRSYGSGVAAFKDSGDGTLIGFPEAFEISLELRSLLPQSFNEYLYFLKSKPNVPMSTYTRSKAEGVAMTTGETAGEFIDAGIGQWKLAQQPKEYGTDL